MQLHYELTGDDFAASQRLFFRRLRPLMFWGFSLYGALFFLFGLWVLTNGDFGSALVPLLFGVWAMLYVPVIVPGAAKRGWAKQNVMHGPTTLAVSAASIEVSNPLTSSQVRGQAVQRVLEDAKLWMVFIGPASYYIVPKRVLATPEARAQLAEALGNLAGLNAPIAPIAAP